MLIYEKNLAAIQNRDAKLYQAIMENEMEPEEMTFHLDTAKNGEEILYAMKDGKLQYMNSRYNPQSEAERFAAQYHAVPDYAYMIFFGLANGGIARKIIESRGENVKFLFYEPSPNLFLLVLKHFDITDLFECPRVRIVVAGLNDDYLDTDISMNVHLDNYKYCYFDVLPTYKQLFEEEEKKLEHKYRFLVVMVGSNVATACFFGKAEAYNNVYNMRYLFKCNCEEEFDGVFPTDRPAIVVAAGPSLEKNVHYLKEAKGKFLIIAVDAALRYLVEQGVQPDIAIVADPKKPVKLFEDERVQQLPLGLFSAANYEVIELMKQKIIFLSSECSYYDKIFALAGKHMYSLAGGGSVATFAFVLAIAWGYRKIVLVGQDLAFSNKIHAGNDDYDTEKLDGDKVEIEGYYGDKVYSSPDYVFYKEWYEMEIKGDDDLEVINATEGGAKIDGTVPMALKEVIDSYDVEPFDFEKTIREMPPTFSAEQRECIVQMWRDSIENLHTLKQKLYDGIRNIKSGIQLIKGKRYTEAQVARIQRKVNKIIVQCNEFEEIYFVDRMVAEEEGDVLGDIYDAKEDDAEEVCRMFEKTLKYMKAMHAAVDEVREMFEKVIKDTTEAMNEDEAKA
jgi:hypothetical protein